MHIVCKILKCVPSNTVNTHISDKFACASSYLNLYVPIQGSPVTHR